MAKDPSSPSTALGKLEIRVGDSVLLTSQATLVEDIKKHNESNPGFIDSVESTLRGCNLQHDAPAVSIFQDGRLEFYQDLEMRLKVSAKPFCGRCSDGWS